MTTTLSRDKITPSAGVVELVDSVDLGAVTLVKVFLFPLSLRTSPQTGVAIRSSKAGSPVFINVD